MERPGFPEGISTDCEEFLEKVFQKDHFKPPSIQDLLNSNFLTKSFDEQATHIYKQIISDME